MKINKNRQFNRQSDRGFTLVELIVSMAILVIVGAAIIAFFSVAMMQYKNSTNETNLQTESRMAWKKLESNILMTNKGIYAPNDKEIWLFNLDSKGNKVMTRIYYDEGTPFIRYEEYNLNDVTTKVITSELLNSMRSSDSSPVETQVFADLVSDLSIAIYDKKGNNLVGQVKTDASIQASNPSKVEADMSYQSGERTYASKNYVAIRNEIVESNNMDDIYKQ